VFKSATLHRLGILDLIKAIACNLIILHHLAFYGPMADFFEPLLPEFVGWLKLDARLAVQAFLVIGGFLAAKSLSPHGAAGVVQPLARLCQRYLKLAPPFLAAMTIAVLASGIARHWMQHDSISAPVRLGQFAAHALLLQDVLGFEALSAGAWYVAIDFQLYALLLGLLWLAGTVRRARGGIWVAPLLVGAGAALSLWYFNLDPGWNVWAPYFFGSYGLGALAWWACSAKRSNAGALFLSALLVVLAGIALLIDFRSRIALAAALALLLVAGCRAQAPMPGAQSAWAAFLGRISYSVFLLHFPVCLLVNAAFTRFAPATPEAQGCGLLMAWLASLVAGHAFHRWVETPLAAWSGSWIERRPHAAYGSSASTIR
jgi:peptidoglycan/LPS O-acetylase OafA/YrhL